MEKTKTAKRKPKHLKPKLMNVDQRSTFKNDEADYDVEDLDQASESDME